MKIGHWIEVASLWRRRLEERHRKRSTRLHDSLHGITNAAPHRHEGHSRPSRQHGATHLADVFARTMSQRIDVLREEQAWLG
jgi:hypothetical protein